MHLARFFAGDPLHFIFGASAFSNVFSNSHAICLMLANSAPRSGFGGGPSLLNDRGCQLSLSEPKTIWISHDWFKMSASFLTPKNRLINTEGVAAPRANIAELGARADVRTRRGERSEG
jgi:hypothetical protein